jgi:serine/threonine protein phosphatase 1
MRKIVVGDIHGRAKALEQCFERSKFDFQNDTLISLGDITDGGSEVYECVELLLQVENLIPIRGNHDQWFVDWIETGIHPAKWLQGGYGTLRSYIKNIDETIQVAGRHNGYITGLNPSDLPDTHIRFWKSQAIKYIDEENRCFVHGGFNRNSSIREQSPDFLIWDRELWNQAMSYEFSNSENNLNSIGSFKMVDDFKEVYIGHTTTMCWNYKKLYKGDHRNTPIVDPIKAGNIYNLDTGAGSNGKLTFMDVNTKKYWQSDFIEDL